MIYFDNAATSAIKPKECYKALRDSFLYFSGNPGRGSHKLSMLCAEKVYESRSILADFFGTDPERIIFTCNATHSLNIAIKGAIGENSSVVTSNFEHNSVLRPLYKLRDEGKITLNILDYNINRKENFIKNINDCLSDASEKDKAVVLTFTSNVCGANLPIKEVGDLCKKQKTLFIVDASQAAGIVDIKLDDYNIDILCTSGHKGLYGIGGSGILAINKNFSKKINTLLEGGSGVDSRNEKMPDSLPESLEAGTLSLPAIMTMASGVEFIKGVGISNIEAKEKYLREKIFESISNIDKVTIYAPNADSTSIVLLNMRGYDCDELSYLLSQKGICTRSGLHCAPLVHKALGCDEGAVRISVGYFNNVCECDKFVMSLYEISKGR